MDLYTSRFVDYSRLLMWPVSSFVMTLYVHHVHCITWMKQKQASKGLFI